MSRVSTLPPCKVCTKVVKGCLPLLRNWLSIDLYFSKDTCEACIIEEILINRYCWVDSLFMEFPLPLYCAIVVLFYNC